MSWLSRVSEVLEAREEEKDMATFVAVEAVIASRRKSVAKLEAECVEYTRQADAFPIGPARDALRGVLRVKEDRLRRLRAELVALEEAVRDPRQGELVKKAK